MIRSSGQAPYAPRVEHSEPLARLGYVNQAHALADLGDMGMSHEQAKQAGPMRSRVEPDQQAWCSLCHAIVTPTGWATDHLPYRAQRAAATCAHERIGCALPNLPSTDATPDTMSRGRWTMRADAKRVHSPHSKGAITVGRLGIFAWHAVYVTGRAAREQAGPLTPDNAGRPIVTTKGTPGAVPMAVDGYLAGDPSRVAFAPFPVTGRLLANGKAPKAPKGSQAAKDRTAKARAAKAAKAKATKAANAERAAAKGPKAAKATKAATNAILADLADLASKVRQ